MNEKTKEAMIAIAATVARDDAKRGTTLEERIKLAMAAAKHFHLLHGDEGAQFKAACAGVLATDISDEDKARITAEHKFLSHMSFVMEGAQRGTPVPIDWDSAPKDPIGLMGIWKALP